MKLISRVVEEFGEVGFWVLIGLVVIALVVIGHFVQKKDQGE